MAEDIYKRYADLTRRGQDQPKTTHLQDTAASVLGTITAPQGGAPIIPSVSVIIARMRARFAANAAKAGIARRESQLSLVNPQLIANAQALNQRAATEGQVYSTRSAEGTADLASGQDGDTETPGGTSGRRRRTPAAVGSIRI